ncbi:hypothetical protein [Propionibacterium freudenreichii]|uniref:hypothetical protein n=1 Tax=Propionibacterium freudenreichii TaxID=1744 RepID=UPI0005A5CB27|nr:hypothetical protein [Propionibacterium freudenreichii]MDK9349598.1 hypothetical protein [Propionibacterium freudenreichii]MDK9628352.1 hypothetical protein [Propionibacterium freudenreichii]MDK9653804.1 hypothetical protein [Propionibacterium freudenreichii]CEI31703.1 Hypothetical protein PFCIRM527_11040 [Propionibacterium freudenreichii]SBN42092.1 Hypothetical protein PFR_JS4_2120 [Propionibacterium freudenreichii]
MSLHDIPTKVPTHRAAEWPGYGMAGCDEHYVERLCRDVDQRVDRADHRLLLLLKTWFECRGQFDDQQRDRVRAAILGFRYDVDHPGSDAMCTWTESHQISFAVCEYLAGQEFVDNTFTVERRRGGELLGHGATRVVRWLSDRFRYGFSEWLSGDCYAIDVAALTLLIDYARDEKLVIRASMVLDLLLADLALHRFDGRFVAASASASAMVRMHPEHSAAQVIVDAAYGPALPLIDTDQLGAIFVCRHRYKVPLALREIAASDATMRVLTSQGLDVDEVPEVLAADPNFPRTSPAALARFWWAMQAFTNREVVSATRAVRMSAKQSTNRFLASMTQLDAVPASLRSPLLRALRPVTDGVPGGASNGRASDGWAGGGWVGNGVNPDIAQRDNLLLVQYDLSGRRGHLEGNRNLYTHIHFPFVDFDVTRVGPTWVAGSRDGSYVGIVATSTLDLASEFEVVQRGVHTGYAVVLGDEREFRSIGAFVDQLKQHRVALTGDRLSLRPPYGKAQLTWQEGLRVGSRRVPHEYARYKSRQVSAERFPQAIPVRGDEHLLLLDWEAGSREDLPIMG